MRMQRLVAAVRRPSIAYKTEAEAYKTEADQHENTCGRGDKEPALYGVHGYQADAATLPFGNQSSRGCLRSRNLNDAERTAEWPI